jgi:arylsulfatase
MKDHNRFFSPQSHFEDDVELPAVERGTDYYVTTAIAEKAIEYLKHHNAEYADQPFFSYVAFTSPHFPLHALPEDIEKIGDRYAPGWDTIREERWERIRQMGLVKGSLSEVEPEVGPPYHFPESLDILGEGEVNRPVPWNSLTSEQQQFQQDKMTIHAAMVERMDKEIGRMLDQLEEMGELENTFIVFLSDNGASAEIMVRGDGHDPQAERGSADSYLCLGPGWSTMSNTPFRKHKTWVHEGGACTPCIVHWPKGIDARGELRHDPGHVIDLLPTMLEMAGIPVPDTLEVPLPGQSLAPTFEQDTEWQRSLWWYHEGHRAFREGDWKIVSARDEPWELINMAEDRTESNDLAAEYPEKVEELEKQWEKMLARFREVTPVKDDKPHEVEVTDH